MPIKIPNELPAVKVLNEENIFVMRELRALSQDIRPLRILVLNLMPNKIETETQLSRLLANTSLQVEMDLIHTKSHQSRNTAKEHLLSFYQMFDDVKNQKFDGMIITGAPVEQMRFEDVEYWDELCEIMEWSKTHVTSTLHICWGAQAGLYYHYSIPKQRLPQKLSGVFEHTADQQNTTLLRGFDDTFFVPHSRYTTVLREDIERVEGLSVTASSIKAGVYAVIASGGRQIFIMGHAEYDADTLKNEYERDLACGIDPSIPENYFPDDNPLNEPKVTWRSHANLLYANWLNYFVYQVTPYDSNAIK